MYTLNRSIFNIIPYARLPVPFIIVNPCMHLMSILFLPSCIKPLIATFLFPIITWTLLRIHINRWYNTNYPMKHVFFINH